MKATHLLLITWITTLLVASVQSAPAGADDHRYPGRPGHPGRPGYPGGRDFYRLDQLERDFLRFDDDFRRAPIGSWQSAQADRFRRDAYAEALRESARIFTDTYQSWGNVNESRDRALRYSREFAYVRPRELRGDFYRELAESAFLGIQGDLQQFERRARYYELESLTETFYSDYANSNSYSNPVQDRGFRGAFQNSREAALRVLNYELARMSFQEARRLEMELDRKLRSAPRQSELERFYYDAILLVRRATGGGGYPAPYPPQPAPYPPQPAPAPPSSEELKLMGVSREGVRVDERGGSLRLARRDEINLQGFSTDSWGGQGGRVALRATVLSADDQYLQISQNQDGSVTLRALMAMSNRPAVELLLEGRLPSGATRSLRLQVSVVRREFRGFDRATATDLVTRAYRAILFRAPDESGLRQYTEALLRDGLRGWSSVLTVLATSPEFLQNVRPRFSGRDIVSSLYENILGRRMDPAGEGYIERVERGQTAQVAVEIGNSDEFMDRVLP